MHYVRELGPIQTRSDIKSSIGQYRVAPEYRIKYPEVVVKALGKIYQEYNSVFKPLVENNREWERDYERSMIGVEGGPMNCAVQIDMVGLPEVFLETAENLEMDDLIAILKGRIFEIENSVAMYQLLEGMFTNCNGRSKFDVRFRAVLEDLRVRHNMKIALLAVTDDKYRAMRESEFGCINGDLLTDEEVKVLSGFDKLLGPKEFLEELDKNGGESPYLLYVRSSEPVAKLKNPKLEVENPLLSVVQIRRAIRAAAITFNVDAPEMPYKNRINDTKDYLHPMGMAYPLDHEKGLYSEEFAVHLEKQKSFAQYADGMRLSGEFAEFLTRKDIDPMAVENGNKELRAKPAKASYGCYGHVKGALSDGKFRSELRRGLNSRGSYVIQPEFEIPRLIDEVTRETYAYIDRNFMGMIDGQPIFISGFRSLMPTSSEEFRKGRNHGNGSTIYAEISD